jgi:hypothetical protein
MPILIAVGVVALLTGQSTTSSVQEIGWMAGCWKLVDGNRSIAEQWMPPDGGTMLGMSRTVKGGSTVEYEFLLIRSGSRVLEYVAHPSGQPEAVFTATRVSAGEVVFENPQHDFPTRITYRKQPDGLVASIAGSLNGKPRSIEFPYKPATCGR